MIGTSNNSQVLTGVAVLLIAAVIIGFVTVNNGHVETYEGVVVSRVDLQQEVSTDDNGKVNTKYVCKVYTDRGLFEVEQSGWLARPELIAQIKAGDTLDITVRGFSMPTIGMYPTVTSVAKR